MSRETRQTCRRQESLSRESRLTKRSDFQEIQRTGWRVSTRDLILLWRPARGETSRLGVTVSRKVDKRATRRNRLKRWIREAYRKLPGRDSPPMVDLVVIAKFCAPRSSMGEIHEQMADAWSRIRARQGPRSGA